MCNQSDEFLQEIYTLLTITNSLASMEVSELELLVPTSGLAPFTL